MTVATTRQLLESGVHFGHQTRHWSPKMKRFIFAERDGVYIVDPQLSLSYINSTSSFVKSTVVRGGRMLFVGTKRRVQEAIVEQATRVGMPCVNQHWLGGMLTSLHTVTGRTRRLKELEGMDPTDSVSSGLTKKELLRLEREKNKLSRTLGGTRDMVRTPQAVWAIDTKKGHLTVDGAHKLHIPITEILDTNCDPDEVDYAVSSNDGAIRSVALLTRIIADAVAEDLIQHSSGRSGGEAEAEPVPGQEHELLTQGDNVTAEAPETSETPTKTESE